MALTYDVCQLRDTGYTANANNSEGKKSCQIGLTQKYLVTVTDPANPSFGPDDVTDVHVAYAPGIPLVNYHTWYDSATGIGIPMAVCNSKTVTRSTVNGTVFTVTCSYRTENGKQSQSQESENPANPEPQPPPETPSDIDPVVTRSVVGRDIVLHDAVAYQDNDTPAKGTTLNPESISTRYLPVDNATRTNAALAAINLKNDVSVPVTRKQAMLQFTITQFEEDVTDADMLDRTYKANMLAWRGFPAKSAMITSMNAVEQSIKIDDGAGGVEDAEWYRVTYNILVDEYEVQNQSGPLFVGHAQAVPMIGRFHNDTSNDGKIIPFQQSGLGVGAVGLVDFIGEPLADQDGAPNYVRYDTVGEVDFAAVFPDVV